MADDLNNFTAVVDKAILGFYFDDIHSALKLSNQWKFQELTIESLLFRFKHHRYGKSIVLEVEFIKRWRAKHTLFFANDKLRTLPSKNYIFFCLIFYAVRVVNYQ